MNQKASERAAETMERSRRVWPKQVKPEVLSHLDMHADHRRWLGDHDMWRDDVSVWQKELEQAFDQVEGLKGTLRAHREAMLDHLNGVATEGQTHKEHEQALADFEQGGQGNGLLPMAKAHNKHASTHVKQQHAHERLKWYHHTLMAHLSSLLKAIREMKL
jgi:hypothetical protein